MRVSSTAARRAAPRASPGRARGRRSAARRRVRRVGAAQQRAHPREQLLERERLDQIVVGAGVEAGDPVADAVARGQHQDRQRLPSSRSRRATSRPSMTGMSTSSTTRVGLLRGDPGERVGAVLGQLDPVALELERAAKRLPDRGLVVDDQQMRAAAAHASKIAHARPDSHELLGRFNDSVLRFGCEGASQEDHRRSCRRGRRRGRGRCPGGEPYGGGCAADRARGVPH